MNLKKEKSFENEKFQSISEKQLTQVIGGVSTVRICKNEPDNRLVPNDSDGGTPGLR